MALARNIAAGDFQIFIDFDKRQLVSIQTLLKEYPIELKKELRKEWRKAGNKIIRKIRAAQYSGPTGRRTVRSRTKKGRAGDTRGFRQVKKSLKVKKIKFTSSKNSFGGYMVMGFTGAMGEKKLTHFIAWMLEFGSTRKLSRKIRQRQGGTRHRVRPNLPARLMLETGWKAQMEGLDLTKATDAAIGRVLERLARKP